MTALTWTELQDFVALLCSVCLPGMALEEAVGSSWWSWADPCLPGREGEPEWAAPDIKNPPCVWEGSCSSESSCVQAGEERRCCWRQRNSRCVSEQLCCSAVSQGCFTHSLFWAALDAPTAGEGPLAHVQHQSVTLHHFFLSLKIYSLLFREMQHENLQSNHFLFR